MTRSHSLLSIHRAQGSLGRMSAHLYLCSAATLHFERRSGLGEIFLLQLGCVPHIQPFWSLYLGGLCKRKTNAWRAQASRGILTPTPCQLALVWLFST
jgi:hypothetical protein